MVLRDVVRILDAEVLSGESKLDVQVLSCGAADMMSDILALCRPGQLVLTGYIYPQVVRTALISELLGLVVVRGKSVPPETVEFARQNNFFLVRTKIFMFTACGKLREAGLKGVDER